MQTRLTDFFQETINAQTLFMNDQNNLNHLQQSIDLMITCLQQNGTVFACGNGGSHADANHFIAELTGRYEAEREPLAGIVLGANPSHMSAVANDYGFDHIFARELQALGKSGDILVAISTSGNSQNIIKAVEIAKTLGIKTIGWLGGDGGALKNMVDISIAAQAGPLLISGKPTFQIQNIHHVLIHATCKSIELSLS